VASVLEGLGGARALTEMQGSTPALATFDDDVGKPLVCSVA